MFDLRVLAYRTEITRISTLMLARENSNAIRHKLGVPAERIGDSTEPLAI